LSFRQFNGFEFHGDADRKLQLGRLTKRMLGRVWRVIDLRAVAIWLELYDKVSTRSAKVRVFFVATCVLVCILSVITRWIDV